MCFPPVSRNLHGREFIATICSLRELWLIRTTLLFICLTCGNICNSFLVREISERTWFDFQTHVANENQPPESEGQWGTSKGVLSSPHPSYKHQHLLEVRLKRSCWNSETQFQPERGSDVWCIMRAGDCPLLHIIIRSWKKMKWLKQITAVFILLFKDSLKQPDLIAFI